MSGEKRAEPPTLDGEVWRGKNVRGTVIAVTIRENECEAWFYDFVWQTASSPYTFRAWALHERAVAAAERERADKAEAILAAAPPWSNMKHNFSGLCPEGPNDHDRDPNCAVCRAMGKP